MATKKREVKKPIQKKKEYKAPVVQKKKEVQEPKVDNPDCLVSVCISRLEASRIGKVFHSDEIGAKMRRILELTSA